MPPKSIAAPISIPGRKIASRRILRLALGLFLAMAISQIINWPLSFITPIFAALLLSLPLPPPTLKLALLLLMSLMAVLFAGFFLLPYLYSSPLAGVLLLSLALFASFLYAARGGSPLLASLFTLSLTLLTTVGTTDIDLLAAMTKGIGWGTLAGFLVIWIAHALVPDTSVSSPAAPQSCPAAPEKPDRKAAAANALRALIVVLPITLLFLCLSSSASYTIIMVKVASMGQQTTAGKSRTMGRDLLESTFWGGLGAVVAWIVLSACPMLLMYCLLIALTGLLIGPRIFNEIGIQPRAAMWQYALTTMITVLAPTVGSMASGQSAGDRLWLRLLYFLVIALYGTLAVAVFDAFFGKNRKVGQSANPISRSPA